MFLTDRSRDRQLFAFTVRDLVAEDSDIWLYIDLFDQINLDTFDWSYSNEGQHPIDPRLMLRTLFYGLTHGVVSGHKLESVCRNDNRFIVLSGDLRPNRRTFDRFLTRHHESFEQLFVQIVRLAQTMGLVSLGRVAIDGSRFKANTSPYKQMAHEKMERAMGYIKAELEKLRHDFSKENAREPQVHYDRVKKDIVDRERRLEKIRRAKEEIEKEQAEKSIGRQRKEVPPKASKSLNDAEALSMASRNKTFIFGYNAQAVVDADTQIVVACDIHEKATDYQALPKMLDQVQENCGYTPSKVLGDLGYKSAENIQDLATRECEAFLGTSSNEKDDCAVEFYEQISPTEEPHRYRCMAGKIIPLHARRLNGATEFKFNEEFCRDCPFKNSCKGYGKKTIYIPNESERKIMAEHRLRSRTDEFKEVYKKRKAIVEPVFGNIKNKGIRILVVGKKKVGLWWKIACTAHNIEKIVKRWGGLLIVEELLTV